MQEAPFTHHKRTVSSLLGQSRHPGHPQGAAQNRHISADVCCPENLQVTNALNCAVFGPDLRKIDPD